jgi:plastocyanin
LVVSGLVHLQLYFLGYRTFPDANLGRSFVANAAVSAIVAGVLVVRDEWFVRAAAMAVAIGTLVAFGLSRSTDMVFGFTERGLEPSPQAAITVVAELAAIGLIALTFLPRLRAGGGRSHSWASAAAAAAAAIVVVLALGGWWARSYGMRDETVVDADDAAPVAVTTAPAGATTNAPTTTTTPATTSTATAASTPAGAPSTAPATTAPVPIAAPTTAVPSQTTAPPVAGPAIAILEFEFVDAALTVPLGSTVTWTNADQFDHSVVADDDSFISGSLGKNDTFEHTFSIAGEYSYICGIHPYMEASVTVAG